jgi:hypothetical protein
MHELTGQLSLEDMARYLARPAGNPVGAVKSSELLRRALSLISDPDRWHQGGYFGQRTSVGRTYCALGALYAAAGYQWGAIDYDNRPLTDLHFVEALTALGESVEPVDLVTFNDDPATRHHDVLEAYSLAILLAGSPSRI